jgi:hypothetical protein
VSTGPQASSAVTADIAVSRETVAAVVQRCADRVSDLARRLGASPDQARMVVERAAAALIDEAATRPRELGDLAGRWFRDVRALVAGLRAEGLLADPVTSRRRAKTPEEQLEKALVTLDERRVVALLLRDSYDLPLASVAAGLGLSVTDGATVVAEARLRLLEVLEAQPAPTLAGHPAVAGISFGSLGRHADGSLGMEDAQFAARQRHVQTCAMCAGFVDAQRRARRSVAGLRVNALADGDHEELVERMTMLAAQRLPTQQELQALLASVRDSSQGPSLRLVGVLAGLTAVLLGTLLGVATADRGGTGGNPSVAAAGPSVALTGPSDSPSPSAPPSPSASVTSSVTASATVRASVTPSRLATPTRRPSPSRIPSLTPTSAPVTSRAPHSSSVPNTVPAGISLSPTSGPNNSTVTVTGRGFRPGATVTVTYSSSLGLVQSTNRATVGEDGTFSTSIVAADPSGIPGPHNVNASDGARSASATFTAT